jgi:hypothetical protein
MVGFYATEEEAAAMMAEAKRNGKTLTDWLKSLIPPTEASPLPKSSNSEGSKKKKPS